MHYSFTFRSVMKYFCPCPPLADQKNFFCSYREILHTDDGGEIAIDWVHNDKSPHDTEVRPTVLVLPGLTGSFSVSFCVTSGKCAMHPVFLSDISQRKKLAHHSGLDSQNISFHLTTGSSTESYARHLCLQAQQLGYRAVVFNYRGNGGAKLLVCFLKSLCLLSNITRAIQSLALSLAERQEVGTALWSHVLCRRHWRTGLPPQPLTSPSLP